MSWICLQARKFTSDFSAIKLEASDPEVAAFVDNLRHFQKKFQLIGWDEINDFDKLSKYFENYEDLYHTAHLLHEDMTLTFEGSIQVDFTWTNPTLDSSMTANSLYNLCCVLYNGVIIVLNSILNQPNKLIKFQEKVTYLRKAKRIAEQFREKSVALRKIMEIEQFLHSELYTNVLLYLVDATLHQALMVKREQSMEIVGYYKNIEQNYGFFAQTSKAYFKLSQFTKVTDLRLKNKFSIQSIKKLQKYITFKVYFFLVKETVISINKLNFSDKNKQNIPKILKYGNSTIQTIDTCGAVIAAFDQSQKKEFNKIYKELKDFMEIYNFKNEKLYKKEPWSTKVQLVVHNKEEITRMSTSLQLQNSSKRNQKYQTQRHKKQIKHLQKNYLEQCQALFDRLETIDKKLSFDQTKVTLQVRNFIQRGLGQKFLKKKQEIEKKKKAINEILIDINTSINKQLRFEQPYQAKIKEIPSFKQVFQSDVQQVKTLQKKVEVAHRVDERLHAVLNSDVIAKLGKTKLKNVTEKEIADFKVEVMKMKQKLQKVVAVLKGGLMNRIEPKEDIVQQIECMGSELKQKLNSLNGIVSEQEAKLKDSFSKNNYSEDVLSLVTRPDLESKLDDGFTFYQGIQMKLAILGRTIKGNIQSRNTLIEMELEVGEMSPLDMFFIGNNGHFQSGKIK